MIFSEILDGSNAVTFAALCAGLVGMLFWIIKRLFTLLHNDVAHIKKVVDSLPCRENCPVETDD